MNTKREIWIDNVKVFACVLVVLGHFFPSLIESNILQNYAVLQWFKKTIYCFHVPLFFIGSGYLYQKQSKVDTFVSWKKNVLKKALALGIPYFAFSIVTWVLKTVFSGSVNDKVGVGLFQTLFLKPASPYWYLYTLFFIFLITPTFRNKRMAIIGLGISFIFKVLYLCGFDSSVYAISTILAYEVWFVIGMCLCSMDITNVLVKKALPIISMAFAGVGLVISIVGFCSNIRHGGLDFLIGLIACVAVVLSFIYGFRSNIQNSALAFASKYTFPIFVLHTICAAPVRIVLVKIGIANAPIHIVVGLLASFLGPIIIAEIIKHVKWLDFFMHPTRYVKVR